jgi:type IV pilus assembly protein PilB
MSTTRLRLGQLLVDARMITAEALDEVLGEQKRGDGRRIGTLLVERGLINETQLTQILSHQLTVPWVSLLHIEFSRQLLNLVPRSVAERFCLVPIYVRHVRGQGQTLYVAMDDPSNEEALAECQSFSGLPVRSMIAPPSDIQNAIRVYYGGAQPKAAATEATPAPKPVGEAPRARRSDRPPRSRRGGGPSVPPAPPPPADLAPPAAEPAARARVSQPAPDIETTEIALEPRPPMKTPAEELTVSAASIPKPRGGKAPRMVSLTLLDGTTITLPARRRSRAEQRVDDARGPRADDDVGLTARDLVAALRAVSHGADASEILGTNVRWEPLFAALLSLLLKKHLIADWEFVDEFKRI